ncbi:glycoside hydrolase family 140 protein, partial [bacterium]|nr:glycoside hydrolase family 140 protein [bacterium]
YECINAGFYFKDWNRYDRFDDFDSRQAAYWAMMAGACGHTYGNNNIWQMWAPGRGAAIDANIHWKEALDHPGAFQMTHLRKLFESYDFQKLVPGGSFIVDAPRSGGAKVRGISASDGSFAFVYTPFGEPFTVDSSIIKKRRVKEIWFDPRYGAFYHIHTSEPLGFQTYTPPTSGRGNDWVLIIEGE